MILILSDVHGMSSTIDTFIYLKRDIEQSFQRLQTIHNSSHPNQHELDQLCNHISCTLDDLQKVHQLLRSSSTLGDQSITKSSAPHSYSLNISPEDENDYDEENTLFVQQNRSTVGYSKANEEPLKSSHTIQLPSFQEREEFLRQMTTQFDYYKTKVPSTRKDGQMEIIRLDQAAEEENEDQRIRKQDEHLEDIHHSILSLKNLTQNINFEINDHIRVLDHLDTDMVNSQNRVVNLTNRTKHLLLNSAGGHSCLFAIAVGLFFLIIILILFF